MKTKRSKAQRKEIEDTTEDTSNICIVLKCRTIKIGSHKYVPEERVLITPRGVRICAPLVDDSEKSVPLNLHFKEIVKILFHAGKSLPVLFLYVNQSCGAYVRQILHMNDPEGPYYNPIADDEQFKRITLIAFNISDEVKANLIKMFGITIDELSPREANDILLRTCPKEVQQTARMATRSSTQLSNSRGSNQSEIRQILIYPPGKGGISINTEDYMCLAQDQLLNDVIIDFYIKYLCNAVLTPEQREKTYVFSCFFYKRLTTKPTMANRSNSVEWDSSLTPAQKRHARIKNWTKNVNLFEHDYIIVPINENCHWFLAIICFPGLDGCRSMIGDKIVNAPEVKKKDKKSIHIAQSLAAHIKEEELGLTCDETQSERDEAEADESDLDMLDSDSDNEDSETIARIAILKEAAKIPKSPPNEPIKQPCILIFDSLAGASRSRVVATLRDYLTCEYHAKISTDKKFTKDNMKGSCPKVPQQNNFTDCGLYLLQYVEHFFKYPINNYHLPIKQLGSWFDEIVVTRKREEISNILKDLMQKANGEVESLPELTFPTLNGKLIEQPDDENLEDSKDTSTGNETETILFATRMVSVTPSHNQIIVNQVPSINSSDNSDTPTRKTFNVNRVQIPVKQNELDKDASKIKVNSAKEKNNLVKNNDTNVAVKTKLSKPEDDEETESKKFKLED